MYFHCIFDVFWNEILQIYQLQPTNICLIIEDCMKFYINLLYQCLLYVEMQEAGDRRHASIPPVTPRTPVCLNVNTLFRKLICDSRSSDSFAERSTVDYIVPGEMELMSAVR